LTHFYIVQLLLESFQKWNTKTVFVGASSHENAKIDTTSFPPPKPENPDANDFTASFYNIGALLINLETKYLTKKYPSLRFNVVNPGIVAVNSTSKPDIILAMLPVFSLVLKTQEQGAATQTLVAFSPEFEKVSGHYFENCKLITPNPLDAYDDKLLNFAYDWSVKEIKRHTKL